MTNSTEKISLIFFVLGVGLCLLSIKPSINYVPLNFQFGLMQMLPIAYFVGIGFCITSILISFKSDSDKFFFVKTLLLGLLVWNIPSMFLSNPYHWDSYLHFFESSPLATTGHIPLVNSDPSGVFIDYPINYPGFSIWLDTLRPVLNLAGPISSSNVEIMPLIRFYPLFSGTLTFIALFLFFKTYLSSVNYRLAMVFAILANSYLQLHLSPESLGFVMGLLVLVTLERSGLKWKIISTVLFGFIIISHPTTLVIVLTFLVVRGLLTAVFSGKPIKFSNLFKSPVFLFVIMWLSWLTLFATSNQHEIVNGIIGGSKNILSIPSIIAQQFAHKTTAEVTVYPQLIRFFVLAVFGVMSIAYLFFGWLMKWRSTEKHFYTYIAFILAPVLLTLADVLFRNGVLGASIFDRFLSFFLIASSILSVLLLERLGILQSSSLCGVRKDKSSSKLTVWIQRITVSIGHLRFIKYLKLVVVPLIIVTCLLGFSTAWYQATFFTINDQAVATSQFFGDSKNVSMGTLGGRLLSSANYSFNHYTFADFYPLPYSEITNVNYVIFDINSQGFYKNGFLGYNVTVYNYYLDNSLNDTQLSRIYDNGEYDVNFLKHDVVLP